MGCSTARKVHHDTYSPNVDEKSWRVRLINPKNNRNVVFKKSIKVAVLDSGINNGHRALKDKVAKTYNAINPDEKNNDNFNHGTAVAGIITGNSKSNNVGIAPNVVLYDVKVLDENGKSNVETVIDGINWSIKQNVDLINISFGFEINHRQLEEAIQRALNSNVIIVASSGNNLGLRVDYPAKYKGVISVAALKPNLKRSSISGKGKIDYAAPGVMILSTDNDYKYSEFNGTSFATAFVTGSIANLLGKAKRKITNSSFGVKKSVQTHIKSGFTIKNKSKKYKKHPILW